MSSAPDARGHTMRTAMVFAGLGACALLLLGFLAVATLSPAPSDSLALGNGTTRAAEGRLHGHSANASDRRRLLSSRTGSEEEELLVRVRSSLGQRLPEAVVSLASEKSPFAVIVTETTNPKGVAELRPAPGGYIVWVCSAPAVEVDVRDGIRSEVEIEVPFRTAREVVVLGANGSPLAGARVLCGGEPGEIEPELRVGRTQADGVLRTFVRDGVWLWASARDHLNSLRVRVREGVQRVTLQCQPGGRTIRGLVIGDHNTPLANARLFAGHNTREPGSRAFTRTAETRTAEDGRFTFAGMPAGPVPVWVRAEGYATHMAHVAAEQDALIARLAKGATVRFEHEDDVRSIDLIADGVMGSSPPSWARTTRPAERGERHTEYHGIGAGQWTAVVSRHDGVTTTMAVAVAEGEQRLCVDLRAKGVEVTGSVRDARGQAWRGALVTWSAGSKRQRGRTDHRGVFVFSLDALEGEVRIADRRRSGAGRVSTQWIATRTVDSARLEIASDKVSGQYGIVDLGAFGLAPGSVVSVFDGDQRVARRVLREGGATELELLQGRYTLVAQDADGDRRNLGSILVQQP